MTQSPIASTNGYRTLLRDATLEIRSLRSEVDNLRQQQREPIAIVGTACRFPGGANSPDAYWELLRNGVDAITEAPAERGIVQHYDPDPDAPGKLYVKQGGFIDSVDQFDPQFFGISPREARSLDPQQRLLLEVSYEALENAGQPAFDLRGTRSGVFIGVSFDDYAQLSVRSGDLARIDAHSSLGNTRSIAAGRIAYTFGFQGPTMQLDTTCSSSLLAVHLACQSLRSGEANLALAGGVNLMLSPEPTIGFCKLKALAPDGRCKTFDAAADGYGRGEGCGVVVLKRLSDAIANQDPILALVRGSAVNHDGLSNGLTAPNGSAQEAVLRQALANANVSPDQVQYVEVHGTGTRLGDPIEVLSLNKVMGQRPTPLLIGAAKTNVGHLESAAGVASLIKVILSLQHRQIPTHLHFENPNPYIPWDKLAIAVPTQLTPWPETEGPRLAGVSSFGMSGTNVHLIVEEAPENEFAELVSALGPDSDLSKGDRHCHLLTLSARSKDTLRELVHRYQTWLSSPVDVALPDICFSANAGRSHFEHRLALVAADMPQLRRQLTAYLDGELFSSRHQSDAPCKVAFLFTGQGSQYVNMGRELYEGEPLFRKTIDRCAEILATQGVDLLAALYPNIDETSRRGVQPTEAPSAPNILGTREGLALSPPFTSKDSNPESRSPRIGGWGAFSPENGQSLSADPPEAIHQTALTQPAIFALEYALAQLWLSWGVQPDAVMGHSIGEYVAACVAGVFSLEEGLRLVAARGRLMQALPAGCGMVAVMASANQVAGLLPEQVAIAAVNGPESIVLSGPLEALDKVVATLTQQDIKTKALPVSHAFHSPLMEPMLAEFREVARTVNYQPPRLELVSLMDEGSNVASAEHWVRHVRQPVQFAAGVNQLVASGYNTFIELGAKPILLSMGRGCIPELDALLLPSLRPEAGWQTLLTSLGQLYAAGADVDWAAFDRAYPRQIVQLPNYPFQRQRYWVDAPGNSSFVIASSSALSASDRPTDHPLLGHPLPLAGAVRYFQARLRPDAPGYLQDHRVFGAAVMPAAGYLESAIAAARSRLSGPLMLQDVSLLKRLVLPEGGVLTQTVLTPLSDDRLKFEMFSQAPSDAANSDPWHRHAEGQIELATSAPRQLSLAAKQNELQGEMAAADFYHTYRQRGIDYGPRFQVLERIWLGTGEALASLREDKRDRAYHVHPVLLDAGLQLAGAALAQTSMTYLPVRVGRLTWFDMDDAPRWVHAKQREGAAGSSVIDVHLLAADGQAVATLSGLVLQQVTSAGLETLQPTAADTTWLYQVTWQPQPLPDRLETLQPPAVICDRLAPEFARLLAQPKFKAYQALLPQLDALALSYSRQALEELGWSAEMGHCDVNQLAIAPQHTALAQRLLDVLAERDVRLYDNAELRTAAGAELKLLTRCGENLAAVLRGDVDPLTLLFPNGDLNDLTAVYERSLGAQVMNALVQQAVSLATAPLQRPVRILEIGAGSGGTTAHLLPHLQDLEGVEYVFTDISPLFLQKAAARFSDYPFVRYVRLDIERSPAKQGFQQPFDLVIAANVLHATADLRQTLDHVYQLLAPGGELVLLENTQPLLWVDLIFGLTDGWWRFTDHDLRPHHPLLSAGQWQQLLQECGFAAGVIQPGDVSAEFRAYELPQAVLVAQRGAATSAGNWLILAASENQGYPLADSLTRQGQSAAVMTLGELRDAADSAPLLQRLQTSSAVQGVVYLGELALSGTVPEACGNACHDVLQLVQTLIKANPIPRLYLATGATDIPENRLARSPLLGLTKTVALEHPELRCTYLEADVDVEALAAELLSNSPEQQVRLGPQRRVARLHPYSLNDSSQSRLIIPEPGTLANLTFQPMSRCTPAADEVEVSVGAAGLNFRDVLMALGQYPSDQPQLGCECAGEVVAVGEAVKDLSVGQRVMGVVPNSFSLFVTVNRALVTPIPDEMAIAAAATIPVAFLTAHYGLIHLARLKKGDRVLIHAAAGGVGQAAVQIAQSVGAEVFATASPGKWDSLRSLGVTHIFNSRTLDFADQVMALTEGEGVDVVLNSLAGDFCDRSIDLLRQGGRFVELGLDTRPGLEGKQYFPVDLVALCQEQPDLIQTMLRDLSQQFRDGTLRPLPQILFPLQDAVQAFRTMQRAEHMGKIILVPDSSETLKDVTFDASYTYLITGGTGGLGLQVAGWMVAQGARHLVLVSRSQPSPAVQRQVQTLESQGAAVEVVSIDVCDAEALKILVNRLAASPHPLRGIIHGAGVLGDRPVQQLSWPEFKRVLAPKVTGAWNLHQLTQDLPLEFFVLFSSAAALLGSPGQANHAAANAFLDGLAHYRRSQGLPGLSLNWGAWSQVGAALKYQSKNALAGLRGVGLIAPEQGLQQLERVWQQPEAQLGVVPIQWGAFLNQGNLRQSPFLEFWQTQTPASSPTSDFLQQLAAAPEEQRRELLEIQVCNQISQILGFAPGELDRRKGFFDLGLDSLTAMELKNSLQTSLGCSLPSTLAFDYPTVERLLDYLAEQLLPVAESADLTETEAIAPVGLASSSTSSPGSSSGNNGVPFDSAPPPTAMDLPEAALLDKLPSEAELAAQLDQKLAHLEDLLA